MRCNRLPAVLAIAALATAALVFTAAPAHAVDLYWDGPNAGGIGDGASDGGNGTWDTTTANWDFLFGLPRMAWNNGSNDTAVFGIGTGNYTVTIGSGINLGGMTIGSTATQRTITFQSTSYATDTLNFAGGSTITTHADGTIRSGIIGSPSVLIGSNDDPVFEPNPATTQTLGAVLLDVNAGGVNGDNSITLGGTGVGNSVSSITQVAPTSGHLSFFTKSGTGTWTVGNVEVRKGILISGGNLIVNGTLFANKDDRGVSVTGGVLHYNNAGAVRPHPTPRSTFDGALQMNGGNLDNTSGAAITTSTYNPTQQWTKAFTFIGSNGAASDLNLGTGAVKINGTVENRQVTVQNAATTLTVGGNISGKTAGYGLTKAGPGTLVLGGNNTYDGPTIINDGTLRVDGSIAASSMTTVNAGGTLSGTGTVGALSLSGGTVSPGGSVGTLPAGNTVWTNTSSFLFEIDDATGTAGAAGGPGWDLLNVAGTLDLAGLTAGGFTINVDTLLPGGGTNPGPMAGFLDSGNYSWEFVRASGGILGTFDAGDFLVDTSGVANPFTGTFGVSSAGNSLLLTYSAAAVAGVPEPGTFVLAALALAGLAVVGRRRRRGRRAL